MIPENVTDIIKDCALGDPLAEAFLSTAWDFFHCVDDVFDRDKPVDDAQFSAKFLAFMLQVSGNSFYQSHRDRFEILILVSWNAWLDSNRGVYGRHILKSWYHELCWVTAFLKGGWTHMRVVCVKHRQFDTKDMDHGMLQPVTTSAA